MFASLVSEAIALFVAKGDRRDNGAGAGWAVIDLAGHVVDGHSVPAVVEIRPTLGDALAMVDMVGGTRAGYSVCPADHAAGLPRV